MKSIVAWFARNPVAANLVMIVTIVMGLLSYSSIKMELFPEFALDTITITVPYPGAAPEEVEEAICSRVEEEIYSLDGVKKVTSSAMEGTGVISVQLKQNADSRRVLDDVKTRVNAINTFPELAEKPIIEEIVMRYQVINVAISGKASEQVLKSLGERVRDEIVNIEGISQVQLASTRPNEISIEISELDLQRYGLTFEDLSRAIQQSSLDLSGGTLKTSNGEVLLRAKGQAYVASEFHKLVLISRPDGSRVLLGDVATIIDGFEDTSQAAMFNGENAVQVQVFRVGEENAIHVADSVKEYVEETRAAMPAGIEMTIFSDASVLLEGRLTLLAKNGFQGLLLVFIVLALFLRFRLAFWVTMGIPISFMGVMVALPEIGQSINMLSLFAFILVLGIIVDDAIVVGESVFTEQQAGGDKLEATIRGANKVAIPVTFAVMTTVCAFAPMIGLPGMFGKYFNVFPLVVIPILIISWAESKVILPAHLAHGGKFAELCSKIPPFTWWMALQSRCERGLIWFSKNVYRPSLDFALRWRYLTQATAIAVLLLTVGAVGGGLVRFISFPKIPGDMVVAQLTMPLGTSPEVTRQAVQQLEDSAQLLQAQIRDERGGEDVVRHSVTAVGEQPIANQQKNHGASGGATGSHLGEVMIELTPTETREDMTTDRIVDRWRSLCGPIPGAVQLIFSADVMGGGDAITIQFSGKNVEDLRVCADRLKRDLNQVNGVYDVADSFRGGKQEIQFEILPSAEALGLTLGSLARQVRQAFYGEEAQRIQRGRDEVKVMVRYPEEDRRTLYTLEKMRIRTPSGDEVPFAQVAKANMGRGFATIQRSNRNRVVTVSADLDPNVTTNGDVYAAIESETLPGIERDYPQVMWTKEGQTAELTAAMTVLGKRAIIALLVIFALMAIPFRSYLQPAIVMSAIPFGIIGAVLGHLLMGHDLSVLSMVGIVALTGVVVNDSLVLVDFINQHKDEGGTLLEGIRDAGVRRFRPIMLTSLTTFAGLTPLMFETSVQAQFLIPMAIALAFGVLFSTAITLIYVPATYLVLNDIKRLFGAGEAPEAREVPEPDSTAAA
jgi:multidrug efflux pump subunit AcrB